MVKDIGLKVIASNRKARHDFSIFETYECGVVLTGTEVKALRMGKANLGDSFALIDQGEVWLENAHIPQYLNGTWNNHATKRKRKLLLHRKEIVKISHKIQAGGFTLVPLKLYFLDGRVKVELGVAKGKKEYDKRQALKERQDNREAARAMAHKNRLGE